MATLLDASGRPIPRPTPDAEQTAQLAPLRSLFEEHPAAGLTPQKLVRVLTEAEQGNLIACHDLFRDMEERDGHILCEIGKRRGAVAGLDWTIEPARDATAKEKADAAWLREAVETLDVEDLVADALDAVGHGFAALELQWVHQGGEWRITRASPRPQSWFQLDPATRTELRLRDNSAEGAALWPLGWLVHRHAAKPGAFARSGLHRALAWPFLFKAYSLRDLAEFLEIYGLPLRLGKYPAGASDAEKASLLRAVLNIGHAAAGVVPEGMSVEFEEAAKGAADPFEAVINWAERTQSKIILGATLTSQADGKTSTHALGNVHNEVRRDILKNDVRQLARTLSQQLVWPLLATNRPGADPRRAPRWVFDVAQPEDLALFADALPKLAGQGMRIPVSWAHEKLRIPLAADDEAVMGATAAGTPPALTPPARLTALTAAAPDALSAPSPARYADLAAERLAADAAPALAAWLATLAEHVESASSLDALRDRLLAAYGDLDLEALTAVMQAGFAAAELAGRVDVTQEQGG